MKKIVRFTIVLTLVITMAACSSSDNQPERVAEKHYLHYFDGSHPGPNDKYAKMATNASQKKEFQRMLQHSHELNMERYGTYKGYEILSKEESPEGNKVTLEIEFKHEKKNKTNVYTLYKTTENGWIVK